MTSERIPDEHALSVGETAIQPTTPDHARPVLDQSLVYLSILLRTNNDAGWKLVFGHCLPLQHNKHGKLATVCGAGKHDGESVLLVTSSIDRHIVRKLS